jgi:hypothetical protein
MALGLAPSRTVAGRRLTIGEQGIMVQNYNPTSLADPVC